MVWLGIKAKSSYSTDKSIPSICRQARCFPGPTYVVKKVLAAFYQPVYRNIIMLIYFIIFFKKAVVVFFELSLSW